MSSSNTIEGKMKDMNIKDEKAKAPAPKAYTRRDHLREIEKSVQKKWLNDKVYESDLDLSRPKFFLNFPYPYMNGRLHLGHGFSLTKAEFTARFQRLQGKNVLFPFAFHCTGMPIQAAANKLKDEIAKYGLPPNFDIDEKDDEEEKGKVEEKSAEATIAAKAKGKKSKLVAKGLSGKPVRQWDILKQMADFTDAEIAEFSEPLKWLNYFPPFGATDLQAFGAAIDWRRSFITTSVNPYYDKFIRWQFNRLKEGNRIKFGKRPNVFSILDGQVCADHDRASGENVGPQEYTIIKLLILNYPDNSPLKSPALAGKKVFLAPATLRPETMYGQTNCYVLPEGDYGAFECQNGDVLIISQRSANGLAYQGVLKEWGVANSLVDVKGTDLIGLPLKAPNSKYDVVYTLPLMTISMGKGTGVVTSVPSDAPDDFAALRELKEKPAWREKFGLTAEMVEPFEVVPIIEIEGYGNMSAVFMCEKLGIRSAKDAELLKKAKDEVYLKGFYEGVMLVGECAGMKVCDAKPIIRQTLMDSGDAIAYWEPESTVMSRTGDECIVALTDQWYLAYGAEDWAKIVVDHIHSDNFNGYNDKIMEKFDQVLGWLKEWACSRQFGLGTKLPWDEQWVIESLSDSTIYMAYYTIAHYFHGSIDNMADGLSPSGIKPEDLNDDIFSFIFLNKPLPGGAVSAIPMATLLAMRQEFEYWYPWDLRVSAKDLIPNHLTMALYNHVEIWKDRPQFWPKGIYCNGHIMVDAEKMSKSKGNFLMLLQCVEEYSADATRFACADAGDSMEDANFDRSVANNAVQYLFNEEEFVKMILASAESGSLRTGELMFMDKAFNNEMDYLIEATFIEYEKMCYRDGIHRCWFDLIIVRDLYRDWSTKCSIPLHKDVIMRFINAITVMIEPICPHWSENIWSLLGNTTSVCNASWPIFNPCDRLMRKQYSFFKNFMRDIRLATIKLKIASPKCAIVYLASTYEEKKIKVLKYLQTVIDKDGKFPADLMKLMKDWIESNADMKKDAKLLLQFGAFMRDEALDRGPDALATEMAFDQKAILEENIMFITKALDLAEVTFYNIETAGDIPGADKKKIDGAVPGKPTYSFFTKS